MPGWEGCCEVLVVVVVEGRFFELAGLEGFEEGFERLEGGLEAGGRLGLELGFGAGRASRSMREEPDRKADGALVVSVSEAESESGSSSDSGSALRSMSSSLLSSSSSTKRSLSLSSPSSSSETDTSSSMKLLRVLLAAAEELLPFDLEVWVGGLVSGLKAVFLGRDAAKTLGFSGFSGFRDFGGTFLRSIVNGLKAGGGPII